MKDENKLSEISVDIKRNFASPRNLLKIILENLRQHNNILIFTYF